MAKVVGSLKHASAPVLTASGKKSEARAVDPEDTTVEVDSKKDPQVVKLAVRKYCTALKSKKEAEEAAAAAAEVLRAYVSAVRGENATQGDYQKTYRVVGERRDKVMYATDVSQSDKWSPIKGVDLKDLRTQFPAAFDGVAEEETTIKIRDDVMKNRAKRLALSKALEAALGVQGIKEYFEKETVWVVKDGMDKKQYELDGDEKVVLEKGFKQVSDSVKDASQPAE